MIGLLSFLVAFVCWFIVGFALRRLLAQGRTYDVEIQRKRGGLYRWVVTLTSDDKFVREDQTDFCPRLCAHWWALVEDWEIWSSARDRDGRFRIGGKGKR